MSRDTGFRYSLLTDRDLGEQLPEGVEVINAATQRTLTESAVGTTSRSISYLWRIGSIARKAKFDLFFFPSVYSYFPILSRTPCVICYHDTTADRFPELVFPSSFNRRLWQLKQAMARFQTTRAMTISQASAQDLREMLGVPPDRIDVVTEGADPIFRVIDDPGVALRARSRYKIPAGVTLLVYVGGINPHKNLLGLLKAMLKVLPKHPVHLAIVGDTSGKGFWDNVAEVKDFVQANAALVEHVHFTGYIDDAELAELLNAAEALVFPSLWEGFGLPAVEAMSCGLPVLASRRGSLPEVIGDAGLFFEPEDPSAIADAILQFVGDSSIRPRLREASLKRVRLFSWQKAAELAEGSFRRCAENAAR